MGGSGWRSGSPGGSNGQIQFNNSGSFGGVSTTGTGNVVLATSPTIATATFTGSTTTAGIADSGGINTTGATGYELGGLNAINVIPSTVNSNGILIGPWAGYSLPNPGGYMSMAIGPYALPLNTINGGENLAVGQWGCRKARQGRPTRQLGAYHRQ